MRDKPLPHLHHINAALFTYGVQQRSKFHFRTET
uniref:Uncharacterized protein n=1 Tax=Anguilla anguilla TaxID=7936 RepID=A0A0E9WA76_ANGAN